MESREHALRQLSNAAFVVVVWFALLTSVAAFVYVTSPGRYDAWLRWKYLAHHDVVLLHGLSAVVALAVGPWQFVPRLRARWPSVHRVLGSVYFAAIAVAAPSGMQLAGMAYGGPVAVAGFCLMDGAWIACAAFAVLALTGRRYGQHRDWSVRCFALTFGAVTLRVGLMVAGGMGLPFPQVYPVMAWLAWVPNLVMAELVVRLGLDRIPAGGGST